MTDQKIIEHATLAEAFVYAQMEFDPIVHNSVVDFTPQGKRRVHYTYADLPQVQKAVYPSLHKHGLSISYDVEECEGRAYLLTVMHHAFSEDSRSVRLRMNGADEAKDLAAEITYLKRYGLGLVTGTGSEEDNDADRLPEGEQQTKQDKTPKDTGKASDKQASDSDKDDKGSGGKKHKETALTLRVRAKAKEIGINDLKDYLGHSSKELDTREWSGFDKLFPTYKTNAQWLADKITKDFGEIIEFSQHYPGGWDALYAEIVKAKEGDSIDGLWSEFASFENKDANNEDAEDLTKIKAEYSALIDGREGWETKAKRVAEEKKMSDEPYSKWGMDEHLNAITALKAEDAL